MAEADYRDVEHTGPGTLAGRYLRMFWQPIHRSRDLPPGRATPVKLMGEELTLYRGESGTPFVVAFRCAHRGTQLSVGWVEEDCIRCRYHGWKYDGSGQCVEQPLEDRPSAERVQIRSYPCREYLGLIFAYLGAGQPPPLRRFPDFEKPFVLEAGPPEIWPCNYFNRIDNDPGHVPYTHRESQLRTGRPDGLAIRKVTAKETEYGVVSIASVPGKPSTYTHFHMPNVNQNRSNTRVEGSLADAQNLFVDRLFWRLPIDDEHCISYVVDLVHLAGEAADAYRERRRAAGEASSGELGSLSEEIVGGRMRVEDVDPGISMYKLFWIEDYVTQVGQGRIPDRRGDRLGAADASVILKRKIWERELRALAEGRPVKHWEEPAGLADMNLAAGGT